jgi:hypothetical protein
MDAAKGTLTVAGTPAQVGLAEWLFGELDRATPQPGKHEYAVPGTANDLVQILHPVHAAGPREVQELINAIRSICEVQRAGGYTRHLALVLRGTQAQTGLADWMIEQVDTLTPGSGTRATDFDDQSKTPPAFHATAARVFALPAAANPQQMQEMVNAIRSISEVQRVVVYTAQRAMVLRATPGQAKLAEWLVEQLKASPGAAGMRATVFDGDLAPPGHRAPAVRVFYLPAATSPADLQGTVTRMRTETKVQCLIGYTAIPAIALRGTDAQAEAAERLMQ